MRDRARASLRWAVVGLLAAWLPQAAVASDAPAAPAEPTATGPAEPAAVEAPSAGDATRPVTSIRWNADIRLRGGQFWQDFGGAAALGATADDRSGGFQRARLGAALERGAFSAAVEVQAEGSSGNLAAATAHLQQAWTQGVWGTRNQLRVRAGRQRLTVGSGLLVGDYDLSDRGRVFDAMEVSFSHGRALHVRALGGRAQPLDATDTRRRLAGVALHAEPSRRFGVDVHLLGHGDEVANQSWRMLTLGAGLSLRPASRWTATAEGALQAGDVRTQGQKSGTDQVAAMGRVGVEGHGAGPQPWRLAGHISVWSGDTEPADQVQRGFRPLFGNLDDAVGWLRLWRPSGLRQAVVRARLPLLPWLAAGAEWRWSMIVAADAAPWLSASRSWRFAGHEPLLQLRAALSEASIVSLTAGNWLQRLPSRPDASQIWLEWRSHF